MRDVDATRLLNEIRFHLDALVEVMPLARARMREWKSEGYPGGAGESSVGSDRHSDPTAQAVLSTAIIDRRTGKQHGYRDLDTYGDRLKRLDSELYDQRDKIRDLAAELGDLIRLHPGDGIEGCHLCDAIRLAIDEETGNAEHECSEACRERKHKHENSHQEIYTRKAPAIDGVDEEDDEALTDTPRCRFHYDFAARYGVDSHPTITRYHLDHLGDRIPFAMIREHHPDEYARYHGQRRTA